jgi:hypothetical protein
MKKLSHKLLRYSVLTMSTLAATTAMAGVTFFDGDNFTGRSFVADRLVDNFATRGFNDRAKSAIVEGGSWEVCMDSNFQGACTVLKPGRYPSLQQLSSQISSVRPMGGDRAERREDRQERREERRAERERERATATLFAGPKFSGRSMTIGGEGANSLNGQFDNQASSLRVTSGYWIFCSQPEFRGECRTFGPGDYSALPPGLDNRISSGRYISNAYPYANNKPNWK